MSEQRPPQLPPTPAPDLTSITPSPPTPHPTPSPLTQMAEDESLVRELMARFVAGVGKKDITWKGARYTDVFIGAEAVDWLCSNSLPDRDIPRSDAVLVGENFRRRGLFTHHVFGEHECADEFHFYKFLPLADELIAEHKKKEKEAEEAAAVVDKHGVDAWMAGMRRPSIARRVPTGVAIGDATECFTIVVLGASGDLAFKKTFPALFGVAGLGFMPKNYRIIGYARSKIEHDEFIKRVVSKIKVAKNQHGVLEEFKSACSYLSGTYDQPESFKKLEETIVEYECTFPESTKANRLFYLALPPSVFAEVSKHLKENCHGTSGGWNRLIVEKPFGHDLHSSNELSEALGRHWEEKDIYRIDHYLGKEMVKNLLVLRFANRFFGPNIWNRDSIDNVQITFKEQIGTEGRGGYFDEFGIIRDVMQNHLMQVLCLVAMEKPVTMEGEDIRNEKTRVLKYIPPIQLEDTLLGQYTASDDGQMEGYLDDPTVPKGSNTPTFAVAALYIKNERWDGVPFILKCAKAMNDKKVEIRIQFKDVPGNTLFPDIARNELVVRIQPDEAVYIKMMNKSPGYNSAPKISELQLTYSRRYSDIRIPDAYEALMVDILRGDHSNFVRSDELAEAWRIFTPLLHKIEAAHPQPNGTGKELVLSASPVSGQQKAAEVVVHKYPAGSRGPEGLDEFVGQFGFRTAPIPYEYHEDFK